MLLASRFGLEPGVGPKLNANGAFGIEEDLDDLSLAQNMQVWIVATLQFGVEESVGRILTPAIRPNISQPAFCAVVGVKDYAPRTECVLKSASRLRSPT